MGSGTININAANLSGTWSPGTYTFADYGTLTGTANSTFNLVNKSGALGTAAMSIDESIPGVISLERIVGRRLEDGVVGRQRKLGRQLPLGHRQYAQLDKQRQCVGLQRGQPCGL